MNRITKIALVTLFVTNFTLFLGWIPIGVLIPQALFFVYALSKYPKAFGTKTMIFYYLFFFYQFIYGLIGGNGYDVVTWGAKFLGMVVPLTISCIIFSPKVIKDSESVSKFALLISFITMLLSIRILINDGNALRVCSMANSTGDTAMFYGYWKQGMANYDMAAMMLFMPVVLIFQLKSGIKRNMKLLLLAGIITPFIFLYLGQVTTTFLLCIIISLMSLLNVKRPALTFTGIGLVTLLLMSQIGDILDYAGSVTGDTAMSERFVSMSVAVKGQSLDDTSDAGIRWALVGTTINSFFSSPLFGSPNASTGGHNFFLDLLAKYGIIGCLPFFLMIKHQFNIISSYSSEMAKRYYLITLIGFIMLGTIKNMSGTEYWNYLFIYYPAILVWFDSMKIKNTRTISI